MIDNGEIVIGSWELIYCSSVIYSEALHNVNGSQVADQYRLVIKHSLPLRYDQFPL